MVVPTVLRKRVFGFLHDSKTGGHFGVNKTIGKIREKFYWPKLRGCGVVSVMFVLQERGLQEK